MAQYYSSISTRYDTTINTTDDNAENVQAELFVAANYNTNAASADSTNLTLRVSGSMTLNGFGLYASQSDDVAVRSSGYASAGSDWTTVQEIRAYGDNSRHVAADLDSTFASLSSTGFIAVRHTASDWCVFEVRYIQRATAVSGTEEAYVFHVISVLSSAGDIPSSGNSLRFLSNPNASGLSNYVEESDPFSASTGRVTITGATSWDGQISGTQSDMILANRELHFSGDNARFTANGTNGTNFYVMNCSVYIDGQDSNSTNNQMFGTNPAHNTSNPGGRDDAITGTKSSDSFAAYYNTEFICDNSGGNLFNVVIGDAYDVRFVAMDPSAAGFTLFTMDDTIIDGLEVDFSRAPTTTSAFGPVFQLTGIPDRFANITLINGVLYALSGTYYIDFLNVVNNIRWHNQPSTDASVQQYVTTDGGLFFLTCPETPISGAKGEWRSRGSDTATTIRGIAAARVMRTYYSDAALANTRKDVKLFIDTEVDYGTGNDASTIDEDKNTKEDYSYRSGTDGILEGTFDPSARATNDSDVDFTELDIPVRIFKRKAGARDGSKNFYEVDVFDLETDVLEMSLWGTRYETKTINATNDIRSTPDDDGRYISLDSVDAVDTDDAMMDFASENTSNITARLTTTDSTSISLNDIAANIKYYAWNTDYDSANTEWSTNSRDGTKFDLEAASSSNDSLILDPSASSTVAVGSGNWTLTCPTTDTNEITIEVASGDIIQSIDLDGLSAAGSNEIIINGGTYTNSGNITDLKTFTATPTDTTTDYSINNATITGNIELDGADGSVYVINDLGSSSAVTLSTPHSNTKAFTVVLSGSTDAADITNNDTTNITIVKAVTFTFGFGSTPSADNIGKFAWVSGSNATNAAADTVNVASSTYTTNISGNDLQITVEVPTADNVWCCLAYDGYELEAFENSTGATVEMSAINTNFLDFSIESSTYNDWNGNTITSVTATTGNLSNSTDDYVYTLNGGDVSIKGAQDDRVRIFIRKEIQEEDSFMRNVALGYVPTDMITWRANDIQFKTSEVSRFQMNRTGSPTKAYWRVNTVAFNSSTPETDVFDQLTTTTAGEDINFTQSADGATVSQVQSVMDAATEDIQNTVWAANVAL